MKHVIQLMLLTLLAMALAGCSDNYFSEDNTSNNDISDNDNSNDDDSTGQVSFATNLTAIEVVNTATGEQLDVGGLPAEGDEIIKD